MPTAQEIVERYTYDVWNRGNLELAETLFAETVVRHDIGTRTEIARADNIQRVRDLRPSPPLSARRRRSQSARASFRPAAFR